MTLHLLIHGSVQGVYFRASAKAKADSLGLSGWVRNTPQGQVEAIASGDEAALNAFVAWCKQGPPAAIVTGVDVAPSSELTETGFSIRR